MTHRKDMLHDYKSNMYLCQNIKNCSLNREELFIAEAEIVPYDRFTMSLGTFSADQPRGFHVKFEPQNAFSETINTQVSSKKTHNGIEYFLEIINGTSQTFSAEIKQF